MRFKWNSRWLWWLADTGLLTALIVYGLAGVPLAPFHGDEGMQVRVTEDYITAFVEQNPSDLITNPPYTIDSRPHLRLINGSVQRYAAGLVLYIGGHNRGDLPIEPGWNWGLNYEDNVAGGWLPKDSVLHKARYVSAGFFAASIMLLFILARMVGGRWAAYPAVLLYGLNPVLLLNGRRAMMEGSFLFFGLLVILLGAVAARRLPDDRYPGLHYYVFLAITGGLALASKHTNAVFLASAWSWLGFAMLWHTIRGSQRWGRLVLHGIALTAAGVGAMAVFVGLSPALWNDPIARLGDLARERTHLLNIQVMIDEKAPTTIEWRARNLIIEPYSAPVSYYEMRSWDRADAIHHQIARYERSGLAGLPTSVQVGLPLTLLSIFGLGTLFWRKEDRWFAGGVAVWLGWTALGLMLNPLPWQRYYLPLMPIATLLGGIGMGMVARWICQRIRTQHPVAADDVVVQTD